MTYLTRMEKTMKEKSQLKIGIFLSYINMIVGNIIPIFYTPVMLNLLGKGEYGLYKLSSSVTSYLSLISLGIGSAVTRYLIKAREEEGKEAEEKVLGLFMIIFQIVAIASLIVGTILTINLDLWYGSSLTTAELERMQILVFLMVCNMALNFSLSPYISVVNTHERFVFLQTMNILTTCIGPALNIVLLYAGYKSIGMTVGSLILGILTRYIYLIYVKKKMHIRAQYKNIPIDLLQDILKFSFWIFVSNVVGQLYNATDTVMIGAVPALATEGVAVYNVGMTFNSIMLSLTTGISNLLAPKVNRMVFNGVKKEELTELATRVGRLQCYIMLLIITGFIAFGQPFIYYYAGIGYEDAYWVAILMMVPNIVPLAQSVLPNVLMAYNKHRFRALTYLFIALFNVVGTWFAMKCLGIIGAALMTGIALIIGQGVIMNWYYKVKMELDISYFWRNVLQTWFIPVIMCIATVAIQYKIDFYNPIIIIVGICVYTIIDIGLNWFFVMNAYEKDLVLGIVKKTIKKEC